MFPFTSIGYLVSALLQLIPMAVVLTSTLKSNESWNYFSHIYFPSRSQQNEANSALISSVDSWDNLKFFWLMVVVVNVIVNFLWDLLINWNLGYWPETVREEWNVQLQELRKQEILQRFLKSKKEHILKVVSAETLSKQQEVYIQQHSINQIANLKTEAATEKETQEQTQPQNQPKSKQTLFKKENHTTNLPSSQNEISSQIAKLEPPPSFPWLLRPKRYLFGGSALYYYLIIICNLILLCCWSIGVLSIHTIPFTWEFILALIEIIRRSLCWNLITIEHYYISTITNKF